MSGNAYTWSTPPTGIPTRANYSGISKIPTSANTLENAYKAGISVGLKDYNAAPHDQGQHRSLFANSKLTPYSSDYYRGYKEASSGNWGGTYKRKNRKTRKTMRKRSYRRRR